MGWYGGGRGFRIGYYAAIKSTNIPPDVGSLGTWGNWLHLEDSGFKLEPTYSGLRGLLPDLANGVTPAGLNARADRAASGVVYTNAIMGIPYNPPLPYPATNTGTDSFDPYTVAGASISLTVSDITPSRNEQRNTKTILNIVIVAGIGLAIGAYIPLYAGQEYHRNAAVFWSKTIEVPALPSIWRGGSERFDDWTVGSADIERESFTRGGHTLGTGIIPDYAIEDIDAQCRGFQDWAKSLTFNITTSFAATPPPIGPVVPYAIGPSYYQSH